jgi:hypothetical protein
VVLEQTVELIEAASESAPDPARLARIASLRRFFELINALATRLLLLEPEELDDLLQLFDAGDEPETTTPTGSS